MLLAFYCRYVFASNRDGKQLAVAFMVANLLGFNKKHNGKWQHLTVKILNVQQFEGTYFNKIRSKLQATGYDYEPSQEVVFF